MSKQDVLKEKLKKIDHYMICMSIQDVETVEYMEQYRVFLNKLISVIDEKKYFPPSNGALLGLMDGISDNVELCSDNHLWNMVEDAEVYYSKECVEW